jgi:hypothetical protein
LCPEHHAIKAFTPKAIQGFASVRAVIFVLAFKFNHNSAGTGLLSEWSNMAAGVNVVMLLQLL